MTSILWKKKRYDVTASELVSRWKKDFGDDRPLDEALYRTQHAAWFVACDLWNPEIDEKGNVAAGKHGIYPLKAKEAFFWLWQHGAIMEARRWFPQRTERKFRALTRRA